MLSSLAYASYKLLIVSTICFLALSSSWSLSSYTACLCLFSIPSSFDSASLPRAVVSRRFRFSSKFSFSRSCIFWSFSARVSLYFYHEKNGTDLSWEFLLSGSMMFCSSFSSFMLSALRELMLFSFTITSSFSSLFCPRRWLRRSE